MGIVESLQWMDERVERLEKNNWLYKFSCWFTFRRKKKLTYKEMYLILRTINSRMGTELSYKLAFEQILNIYKYNNNRLPNDKVNYDDK